MAGYSICPENTPLPYPLPQGEREVIRGLPFTPPLMGGDRGEGEVFSCLFVPMNWHNGLSVFFALRVVDRYPLIPNNVIEMQML